MRKIVVFIHRSSYSKQKFIGGGEIGNEKTIAILNEFGFQVNVNPFPYYEKIFNIKLINYFVFLFRLSKSFISLSWKVLQKNNKIFHISGYGSSGVVIESIIIVILHTFHKKVVYELRGGAITNNIGNNKIFEYLLKFCTTHSDIVLAQTPATKCYVEELSSKKVYYYPNFVEFPLSKNFESFDLGIIRIVYVGRLSENKNIDVILHACQFLHERYEISLSLIGAIDTSYKSKLDLLIKNYKINFNIDYLGFVANSEINDLLTNKHFFIFPSTNPYEGHSNALNEVMSHGIVPIVSKIGANLDVVGDPFLIVNSLNPKEYAERIITIIEQDKWSYYSNYVRLRIENNFTKELIANNLYNLYISL